MLLARPYVRQPDSLNETWGARYVLVERNDMGFTVYETTCEQLVFFQTFFCLGQGC